MLYLKRHLMEQIDQHAIERITLERMMPLAGRRLAEFLRNKMDGGVTLLMGRGPNGGGGLFAISYLLEHKYEGKISIVPAWDIKENHGIDFVDKKLKTMKIYVKDSIPNDGILIDALLGYRLNSPPRGKYLKLIDEANKSKLPIVSLDVPSGLNTETGEFYEHMHASYILSLDVAKHGLQTSKSLYVADLGFEKEDYLKFGVDYQRPFTENNIVKVDP